VEFSSRRERLESIAKAEKEIQRLTTAHYVKKNSYEKNMAERKFKEQVSRKNPWDVNLSPLNPTLIGPDQVNIADEDSRIMPTFRKGFELR